MRISFGIESNKEDTDDAVCFHNVTATLFPHIGHYVLDFIGACCGIALTFGSRPERLRFRFREGDSLFRSSAVRQRI